MMIAHARGERWHFGISCRQCHSALIAPNRSEYVGKNHVRHFWSCENCGHDSETSVNLPASKPNKSIHPVSLVA
jgi:hypothetical protein